MTNSASSRLIEANGLRMKIYEMGAGPLVMLCHGFPETGRAWRHQLAALAAAGYRAVAPDLRGFGDTDAPADIALYSLGHLVGDMVGLLDALGEDNAVIVGNDWGATLAWQAALVRPDRFRAVAAIGVPMIGRPPLQPTRLFPQSDEARFYTLYFQEEGAAEAEFERDVALTLRKILHAASADAGPRRDGDGTPNPFGMVSRTEGLLAPLPDPGQAPSWMEPEAFETLVSAYRKSGFRGGLNYYRNLDRNWEEQGALEGETVKRPALFMVGDRDAGLSIPGMRDIIAGMPQLVPDLRDTVFLERCGHWAPQECPEAVSQALTGFLRAL